MLTHQQQERRTRTTRQVGLMLLAVLAAGVWLTIRHVIAPRAVCVPGTIELAPDIGLIDGPDAGVRVSFPVTNTGREGSVTVSVRLSTSEGMFERRQELRLTVGDRRQLSYFFHEPTINVDLRGVQARVTCHP